MPGIGSLVEHQCPANVNAPDRECRYFEPKTRDRQGERPVVPAGDQRIVALDCFDVRFPTSLAR